MTAKIYSLTLNIQRFDPDSKQKWLQTYQLAAGPVMRFVDLFRKINDELDETLAWASSCEHGQCGTCSVVVNGKPVLACDLLVENAVAHFKTTEFRIKPVSVAPVIRDLVTDTAVAYERVVQAKPWIIKPAPPPAEGNEHPITPGEIEPYEDATRCINCFCCAEACMSSHRSFLGPNTMMAAIVRAMDLREQEKEGRLALLFGDDGVRRCHSSKACSHVCPKEIDVAHYMALAKDGRLKKKHKEKDTQTAKPEG
jgi:succinate dehydrogenase / fumarate reductase iron-sulfur subunit